MLLDLFDSLCKFISSNIIQLAQLVDLAQGQLGLAKIAQAWLAVVLCNSLICFWRSLIKFIENHADI